MMVQYDGAVTVGTHETSPPSHTTLPKAVMVQCDSHTVMVQCGHCDGEVNALIVQ